MKIYGTEYREILQEYFHKKYEMMLHFSKSGNICEISPKNKEYSLFISSTPNMCGTLYLCNLNSLHSKLLEALDDLVNLLGYSCVRCDFSTQQNIETIKILLVNNGFITVSTWKNHRSGNFIETMEKHYDIEEQKLLYDGDFKERLLKIMERNNAI